MNARAFPVDARAGFPARRREGPPADSAAAQGGRIGPGRSHGHKRTVQPHIPQGGIVMKLQHIIDSLLDTDLYKFNMDQVIFL